MALVPFRYNLRSLWVRRSSTLLTMCAIGATVAVLAGMLSLQQGFATMFAESGRDDLAIFLRNGATSEGESGMTREQTELIKKETREISLAADGKPLAAAEMYLAVRRRKVTGGETNVAMRGVEPMTFQVHGDALQINAGRIPIPGSDELIIGQDLVERIADCKIGDTLVINVTPFKIVGTFRGKGGYQSEIWGDLDRLGEALQRPVRSRVIAKIAPNTDLAAIEARYSEDKRVQPKVQTERSYLQSQTQVLSITFTVLGIFLSAIMGLAAVFTGTNAMLSLVSSRTHEIGILLSLGFRPFAVFLAFQMEALLLGTLGGILGCLMVLPFQGAQTGTMNQTFSEVVFAFRTTPSVMLIAILFASLLGLFGGALPAVRAARLRPTEALRRG
ncbi:multidrug ABC transporter permease [Planctomycetota bacterium]|nr:multidrug ABC transporter permease [Planctomycetota bacterium]